MLTEIKIVETLTNYEKTKSKHNTWQHSNHTVVYTHIRNLWGRKWLSIPHQTISQY
jgi:hypothetical protein